MRGALVDYAALLVAPQVFLNDLWLEAEFVMPGAAWFKHGALDQ